MARSGKTANPIQPSSSSWYLLSIFPLVLLPLGYYYIRRYLAARKLAKTGIGRGAPGFQTGVKRLAVTPEIAARLRAGEHVSPEEIEAAVEKARARENEKVEEESVGPTKKFETKTTTDDNENEWIPEENRKFAKGGSVARRGKKRR